MFIEALVRHSRERPSDIAALDSTRTLTFRELAAGSSIMAGHVEKSAAGRGPIGLLLPQSCAFNVALFGTWWAGHPAVPLNYLLSPAELVEVVRDAGIATVFAVRFFQPLAEALAAAGIAVQYMEDLSFFKLPGRRPVPQSQRDELAMIVYTSGTSARPKGVLLSFGNIESNAVDSCEHARFREQMVFLGILPMFHTLALTATCLIPVMLGCKVVYQPRFNAASIFEAASQHGVQVMVAVPSMYSALLDSKAAAGGAQLPALRYAISGGEALPAALAQRFEQRFGMPLLEGFGMTETCAAVTISLPWARKPGSVGQPIPHAELRVVDEAGAALPPGAQGELHIRSPAVMLGYHNRPQETAAAFTSDRFLRTGDLAQIDAEGYLSITGRIKDLINIAGEKVASREIEEALAAHPAVLLVAVIARPDAQRGEVPVAFVQLVDEAEEKPAAADLRAFLRERLAPYKVPRTIYIVAELPRSPTGKILKRQLVVPAEEA